MAGAKGVMGRAVADENGEEAFRGQVIWGLVGHNQSFGFNSKRDAQHQKVLTENCCHLTSVLKE